MSQQQSEIRTNEDAVSKLRELISEIHLGMMTTHDGENLRSRPMALIGLESSGDMWFITSSKTHKVDEIQKYPQSNISFVDNNSQKYVSVSGKLSIVNDRKRLESCWKPAYKAYFPRGMEDKDLCLLKFTIEQAEYWDSSESAMKVVHGFIQPVSRDQPIEGQHEQFEIQSHA